MGRRTYCLAIFSCLAILQATAQYLPILDAQKTEYTLLNEVLDAVIVSYATVQGDTLVGTVSYKKMVFQFFEDDTFEPLGLVREDGGQLWWLPPNGQGERLLADLDLTVGDTFSVAGMYFDCIANVLDPTVAVVTAVQWVEGRKQVSLNVAPCIGDTLRFVEGVGPNTGPAYLAGSSLGIGHSLCRVHREDTLYAAFITEVDCAERISTAAAADPSPLLGLSLYPNPASDVLHVVADAEPGAWIEVRDLHGRRWLSQKIPTEGASPGCEVDISQLPKGVYALSLTQRTRRASARFLKL